MENCLPQRRRICEDVTNREMAAMQQQSEIAYARNNKRYECPAAAVARVDELRGKKQHKEYDESLEYRCPGTMDILSGRMVPCSAAPTLREIALGRRMRRTVVDAPECKSAKETKLPRDLKTRNVEERGGICDECPCQWNENNLNNDAECLNKVGMKIYQRRPEPCCKRKKKVFNQGKCVTFDR